MVQNVDSGVCGDDVVQQAAIAASTLESAMTETLEGADGRIETGVRLDLVVLTLREAASISPADARRLVVFPYGAMSTALANLHGYPRLGKKRTRLAQALEQSMAMLAQAMSLPPPLPRSSRDQDQRRAVRVRARAHVLYYAEERSCVGTAADISTGGLFIESEDLFPVGSEVRVFLVLPPCEEVSATVVVRWIRSNLDSWEGEHRSRHGMGARFVALPSATEAAIDAFVARKVVDGGRGGIAPPRPRVPRR